MSEDRSNPDRPPVETSAADDIARSRERRGRRGAVKVRWPAGLIRVGIVVVLAATSACSHETPDLPADADASKGATAAGSVYADLQVEYFVKGQRLYRSLYDELGAACRELGIGTQLPEDHVAKLGTSRLQVWTADDRVATRNEVYAYTYADGGSYCDFQPVTLGLHLYMDATETVSVDLTTGVESRAPPQPEYRWKREASVSRPIEPAIAERSVNGIPCLEYADVLGDGATYCIWSGGTAYGFDVHGRSVSNAKGAEDGMVNALVIDQIPTRGGYGQRVTLTALVLGDDAPFAAMRPHAPTVGPHATHDAGADSR